MADGGGYQTVTLVQTGAESNNYVLYVVKQNDKNDETSNVSVDMSHDDPDPDDPDVSNVYDFNDGEDPSKRAFKIVRYKKKQIINVLNNF